MNENKIVLTAGSIFARVMIVGLGITYASAYVIGTSGALVLTIVVAAGAFAYSKYYESKKKIRG